MKIVDKTDVEIAGFTTDQIETVLRNALRLGYRLTAERCEAELAKRKQVLPKPKGQRPARRGLKYVSEFHFVCPGQLGVQNNGDGTIWTGTWVVDERLAEFGVKFQALVALHQSKSENSYLQGRVKDWRRSDRDAKYSGEAQTKIETGIDFLIELSNTELPWFGGGSGEKGYKWQDPPI